VPFRGFSVVRALSGNGAGEEGVKVELAKGQNILVDAPEISAGV